MRKSALFAVVMFVSAILMSGCTERVPPGRVGRINSPSGWQKEVLKPGSHTCYGRDRMYVMDITNKSFKETMNILIGGKVNLRVDFTVRVRANTEDDDQLRKAFESIAASGQEITVDQMYETFLKMKVQAVPRQIFEVQPDIQTAVANSPKLATEVRKQITEMAKSTPLIVEDAEITNYDWPDSITKAQEELVKIQLREAGEEAQVRADLKRAEGSLKVAEADMLVELKKAEAVAKSIEIIKNSLAGSPEYLMWHQIRVMGQAAMGPNNCFILYPYNTDSAQIRSMMSNANLSQILKPDGPKPELKKNPAPIEKIQD